MEIRQTQKILLGVLSHALFEVEYQIPEDTDWEALFKESKAQAVAPMVFSCVSEKCKDQEIFRQWKAMTMGSLHNNMNVQLQHGALHKLLTEHNIPYCIIKGCVAAKDYPDVLLRAMGDVDFLIPEEYWEQTRQLLVSDGFSASGEEHAFHLTFSKKKVVMEMHHEPFGFKEKTTQALLEIVPELIEKSTLVHCGAVTFRGPDAFGHGVVLLLHAYRHLIDTGVGVRHLCDWATFVSKFSNQEFTDIFRTRFEELGIWKLAQVFSVTSHLYLGAPYQEWMGPVDEDICRMLMLDIFDGGNFGKGVGERTTQNLSVYNADSEFSAGSSKLQLIRGLNKTAIARYPRLMRWRIFRPFGWIILGVRYVVRTLTGRRQKAPSDTIQMAAMRKNLYLKLNVFEKE